MRTKRPAASGAFQAVSGRAVAVDFDGGSMTSDAGALLLGQADAAAGLMDRLAACFAHPRLHRTDVSEIDPRRELPPDGRLPPVLPVVI